MFQLEIDYEVDYDSFGNWVTNHPSIMVVIMVAEKDARGKFESRLHI